MTSSSEHFEHADRTSSSSSEYSHFKEVLEKLRTDPLSITPEDARRLSEQVEVTDRRSASIVSAVESLALASQDLQQLDTQSDPPPMVHEPRHTQQVLVNDLKAAVDSDPTLVTPDLLKATQEIVSKMQQAIGRNQAPQPGLEPVLQKELARIEPKVVDGTVTKAEADHLHSLEARAHGHTEKGGLTAKAQSIAAKRERAISFSDPADENQDPLDHPSNSKDQNQAGATPASELVAKDFTTHTLAENKHIPSHTRSSSAVEAH
ncbi:hypothetical protein P171DRAFT_182524 [Karstenula rhodostoma CBS 690.94]|uniref:SMP domain-containing protein n=1 Tax=Karstenula rhodostoma CBS 690.94 TaxID=1392251 RepID=A0A9P4U5T4_9PLEO|nr:hypothetical protein P171DRAFT_182524 [Karstenula rhodostoma CBS 690.94]